MGIQATFVMNAEALKEGDKIAAKLILWAAPTLESRVKSSITGWPSGPIVDTGAMLNSVKGEVLGPKEAQVSVGVSYAGYVEFGTYKMVARPFFQTALAAFQIELAGWQG